MLTQSFLHVCSCYSPDFSSAEEEMREERAVVEEADKEEEEEKIQRGGRGRGSGTVRIRDFEPSWTPTPSIQPCVDQQLQNVCSLMFLLSVLFFHFTHYIWTAPKSHWIWIFCPSTLILFILTWLFGCSLIAHWKSSQWLLLPHWLDKYKVEGFMCLAPIILW